MNELSQTDFSDEEKRNLRTLAEEMPDLRLLIEELLETLEILNDDNLTKIFIQAKKTLKNTG